MTRPVDPHFFAWRRPEPLVLASASPTRRALLEATGIPVEVLRPRFNEREAESAARKAGTPSATRARLLARGKALSVGDQAPGCLILSADQTLEAADHPGIKAESAEEAKDYLRALSGRRHFLHSAVVVFSQKRIVWESLETASLEMRPLDEQFIADYVASLGPAALSSVGGYQIEGIGRQLFTRIDGGQDVVLGLPLTGLLGFLRRIGALAT
jgi:septum formation protein